MEPAEARTYLEAPTGRYCVGRTWFAFSADATLYGFAAWGRPSEDDARALIRAISVELGPPAAAHASLIDASAVDGVDALVFRALTEYVNGHRVELGRQVTRLALVRPAGVAGAVVAGFFGVVPQPYPVDVFADREPALAWLGRADAARLASELGALRAFVTGTAPDVAALRAILDADPADATIARAARALNVSERTLQRRLREAGTSFLDELATARIRAAKRMLLDSDAPLTTVALEVGCASLPHFSAMFRRLTGESPSAWRAKRRA